MNGREETSVNNLFYLCSLIEYIARKTKQRKSAVVIALGKTELTHIYDLADVYHCENIDKISDELIHKHNIEEGCFDNVAACLYTVPSFWDIGKVYTRLIVAVASRQQLPLIEALIQVYNSWVCARIDDYNASTYYNSPSYLQESYFSGTMLE
ncbi:MAG: hypothetical protein LBM77_04015 [Spirochaetaceae bacterium]|jgi:hypothetical protein|nr:hypothetical protein [Spirochaetaceae bacterium]